MRGHAVSITLAVLALVTTGSSFAQTKKEVMGCGNSNHGILQTNLVYDANDANHAYHINLNDNGEIPVVVYYAQNISAKKPTSVEKSQIYRMFEEASRVFGEPFHFVIDKLIPVEEKDILTLEGPIDGPEYKKVYSMFKKNTLDKYKLHVYFPYSSDKICGLSSFPIADDQGMIVTGTNECSGSDQNPKAQVLIHELGHFFNLSHTFYNSDDPDMAERVVRDARCKRQGDGFCDTPADFYPSFYYQVMDESKKCTFSPYNPNGYVNLSTAFDWEGNLYNPSVRNYMSYFDNECLDEFTPEQRKMLIDAFEYRTYRPSVYEKFSLYPNPARQSDEIKIKLEAEGTDNNNEISYRVQVFNSMGQLITAQQNLFDTHQNIITILEPRMSSMANGTYIMNLTLIDDRTQAVIYNYSEQLVIIQ